MIMKQKVVYHYLFNVVFLGGIVALFYLKANGQEAVSLTAAERAKRVMQDNEFERSEEGRDLIIHCNPIRLDGHSLDYTQFSIHSQGELTLMVGDPDDDDARAIPFQVYIRRDEKIVEDFASGFVGGRMKMEMSQVLAKSQPGDQLIINPLMEKHWKAKRILKILE